MDELPSPDEIASNVDRDTGGGGGERDRTPSVDKPHEGVVTLLLHSLTEDEDTTGVEFPAFREVAVDNGLEIPEDIREQLELPPEVKTYSWEDFFQLDLSDYEYVGYPPRDRSGDGVTYEDGWDQSDFTGDLTGDTKRALNGHWAEDIQEAIFDTTANQPGGQIAIRTGRESDHGDSFEEAHKYQRFYIQDSPTAPLSVLKARRDVGELTEEEFEHLASENGYVEDDGRWVVPDDEQDSQEESEDDEE